MHMTIMQIQKTILQTHMNIMQIQMKTIVQWGVPAAGHYANPHKTHYIIWVQAIMPASKPVQKFSSSRSSLESENVRVLCVFGLKMNWQSSQSLMLVVWVSSEIKELSMKARITEKRSSGANIILHSCQLYLLGSADRLLPPSKEAAEPQNCSERHPRHNSHLHLYSLLCVCVIRNMPQKFINKTQEVIDKISEVCGKNKSMWHNGKMCWPWCRWCTKMM